MDCKLNATAVILAGGKNSRFNGRIKSLEILRGKRLIDYQLNVLESIFEEVIIIANNVEAFKDYSFFNIFPDYIKDKGPLGGIHSALKNAKHKEVFIVAGDMPFISDVTILAQVVAFVSKNTDSLIPKHAHGIEPLHGCYSRNIFTKLDEHLQNNTTSVRDFLKVINTSYWIVAHLNDFSNINTHNDLLKYSL